jgi:hypothetical protein
VISLATLVPRDPVIDRADDRRGKGRRAGLVAHRRVL